MRGFQKIAKRPLRENTVFYRVAFMRRAPKLPGRMCIYNGFCSKGFLRIEARSQCQFRICERPLPRTISESSFDSFACTSAMANQFAALPMKVAECRSYDSYCQLCSFHNQAALHPDLLVFSR